MKSGCPDFINGTEQVRVINSKRLKLIKLIGAVITLLPIVMGCRDGEKITAFKNVRVVPMTAEKIIENQTVLIKGSRIAEIGPVNNLWIPPE